MDRNDRMIHALRRKTPTFACEPGCLDSCGPVTASSEEMARLQTRTDAEHAAALAAWSCPHLGPEGCRVYAQPPLICRLFGTTPHLPCPRGKGPEAMIDRRTEQAIHRYLGQTRQVLV